MRRFRHCPVLAVQTPAGDPLEVVLASASAARLLGLALLREPPRRGLLIPGCRSVHTWGMRFPIDIVFLAPTPDGLEVVAVRRAVGARRVASRRAADSVLELAAGGAARLRLWPGSVLAQSTTGATAAGAGRTNTR